MLRRLRGIEVDVEGEVEVESEIQKYTQHIRQIESDGGPKTMLITEEAKTLDQRESRLPLPSDACIAHCQPLANTKPLE